MENNNSVLEEAIQKMRADVNPIRLIRKSQQLKAEDLATRAGVSAQSVWKIEKGTTEPRLDTLYAIALALFVIPQTLVDAYQNWKADKHKPADETLRTISADPKFYANMVESQQVVSDDWVDPNAD